MCQSRGNPAVGHRIQTPSWPACTKKQFMRNSRQLNTPKMASAKLASLSCLVLAFISLAHLSSASAYQYPIFLASQESAAGVQVRRPGDPGGELRSLDQTQLHATKLIDENEAHQLHQFHQVVNTVAALLNEEEQQQRKQQLTRRQDDPSVMTIASPRETPASGASAQDLLSESEIRQALEELEKVQQQERQSAESRQKPVHAQPPTYASQTKPEQHAQTPSNNKPSSFDSLIDEYGDELINEQLSLASQQVESAYQQQKRDNQLRLPERRNQEVQPINPKELTESSTRSSKAPQEINVSTTQVPPSPAQPLYIGRIDTAASELGPALTDDFYSFHSDQRPAERVSSLDQNNNRPSEGNGALSKSDPPLGSSDLDSAAQTRNIRQEAQFALGQTAPNQGHLGTLRFDLSAPLPANQNPDNFARSFQPPAAAAAPLRKNIEVTSTLVPIVNSDNFWRPADRLIDNDGLNQNFNREVFPIQSPVQQILPPLPSPRFQSLSPSPQLPQPPQSRQTGSIPFTGHAFLPSDGHPQFQAPNPFISANRDRVLSSTSSPLISVLSGGDSRIGNSVSWNPPATINPPPQQSFNSQFAAQSSKPLFNSELNRQPFYQPQNRNPSFSPFPTIVDDRSRAQPSARQPLNLVPETQANNFRALDTDLIFKPETTTENKFLAPITTTQRSVLSTPQPERDVADTELRTSIRNIGGGQRLFVPSDLVAPTSTSSSLYSEPARPRASQASTTSTSTTTAATQTTSVSAPTNSTKKDDMVIYYYYYYDDNKNATVVAKNVSSSSSSLDEAIEADGGVEDTPYIDDPAPINPAVTNLATTSAKPPVRAATPILPKEIDNQPEIAPKVTLDAGSRIKPLKESSAPAKLSNIASSSGDRQILHFQEPKSIIPSTSNKFSSLHSTRQTLESINSFTTTPNSVPSSSVRSGHRISSLNHDLSKQTHAPTIESISHGQSAMSHQEPTAFLRSTSSKPRNNNQKEVKHNVSSGSPPNTQQRSSLPNMPAPVSPSPAQSNRGPLSNASRYGTNNLLIDPYGLDPALPSSIITQAGHSLPTDATGNHQRNWQASQPSNTQPINRKPTVTSSNSAAVNFNTRDSQPPKSQIPKLGSQTFVPQRNSNFNTSPQVPKTQQGAAPALSRTILNTPAVQLPNRQFYPESLSGQSGPPNVTSFETQRFPTHVSRPQLANQPIVHPPKQHQTTLPQDVSDIEPVTNEDDENIREQEPRLVSNGRPPVQDSSTRNAFSKSTSQISSITPSPTDSSDSLNDEPVTSVPIASSSPQSAISSSPKSAPLSTLSTIVEITPDKQSESPVTAVASTHSAPASSSSTPLENSSVPTVVTTQSTSSSTNSAPDTSSSSETPESTVTSSRKRFGNRNLRFQTRINSLSSSTSRTTSTTSTTQAPSTSTTTRRPVSSTTRRSSKQLYSGKWRLGAQSHEQTASVTNSNSPNNSSSTLSVESTSSSVNLSSTPGRLRFSNSFTNRFRSTTGSPSNNDPQTPSTQKTASLFGANKNDPKSRTPISRSNKLSAPVMMAETTVASIDTINGNSSDATLEVIPSTSNPEKMADKSSPIDSSDENLEFASTSAPEQALIEKKDQDQSNSGASSSESNTTLSPLSSGATPEVASARIKPRIRPLFASRQRNTTLFGNRRSNITSSA